MVPVAAQSKAGMAMDWGFESRSRYGWMYVCSRFSVSCCPL